MSALLLGNIFSFCAAVFLFLSILKKDKKHLALFQLSECVFLYIAYLFLDARMGQFIIATAIIRNLMIYLQKMTDPIMWSLIAASVLAGAIYQPDTLFDYLPIISNIIYTYTLSKSCYSLLTVKKLIFATQFLWAFYNIYSLAIPSFCINVCIAGTCLYTISKNMKQHQKKFDRKDFFG